METKVNGNAMAIFHSTTKIIGRSSGRSSVAAAAYRSGEKLYNDRDGLTHDYTKRKDIVYSEIMLPDKAPQEFSDRETLWNAVEHGEKRKDAQTAREIELALPREFEHREQIDILMEYIKHNFVDNGMIADYSIHSGHEHDRDKEYTENDKDIVPNNPHAHIMLTMRRVSEDGFDSKKELDWNKRQNITQWRENWADICNRGFERKGLDTRIDHRSNAERGLELEPTVHLGKTANTLEKQGMNTERGDINRAIERRNNMIQTRTSEQHKSSKDITPYDEWRKKQKTEELEREISRSR
jgi:ATP-dependent exoDNAse (exonuclease V) alpha subunit